MTIKNSTSLLVLAVATAAPTVAWGQQAGAEVSPSDDIVVTAQKREEKLLSVPISISALAGDTLDRSTTAGVGAALNNVPSVATLRYEGLGSGTIISIRGVSNGAGLAGGSTPIAYYIDGTPFAFVRSSFVPDVGDFDLDRVEVLRGPQGTLYGATGAGGVVRVLTHDAVLDKFDVKARTQVSQTEDGGTNYGGALALNAPIIEGRLAVRGSAEYTHNSGWIENVRNGDSNINQGNTQTYRLKLNAEPIDGLTIGLSAWTSRENKDYPNFGDSQRQTNLLHGEPITSRLNVYSAKIGYDFSGVSISSTTSYVRDYTKTVVDYTPIGRLNTLTDTFHSKVFTQEINLTSNGSGPWRWSVGAFYRDDKDMLNQDLVTYPALTHTSLAFFDDRSKSVAGYGEITREFSDGKFAITGGVRYFHDDESSNPTDAPQNKTKTTASATTPRVVLTWKPDSNHLFYASYAQGFRSGVPVPYSTALAAPSLSSAKPDKLNNYEIGAKGTLLNGRITYDTSLYYIKWNGVQQMISVANPNVPGVFIGAIVNSEAASGMGIDASLSARVLPGLELSANFGWSDLTFDSDVRSAGVLIFHKGDRLNLSPKYTAGGTVRYDFAVSREVEGHFSLSGNYRSVLSATSIQAGVATANPASQIFTATSNLRFDLNHHVSAAFFIDNLTNNNSTVLATRANAPQFAIRLRPRTFGLQLSYRM